MIGELGINNGIARGLKELHPTVDIKAHGLAESVAVRGDEDVTLPAIILPNGECLNVYAETDKHDVTLYHRLNSVSFQESGNDGAFGSLRGYIETDDVSLIVFGKREALSPYRMEKIARDVIAKRTDCILSGSDFNSLQVFANEYIGVTYFMPPQFYLFKINYRITRTYNARCTNLE